MAELRLCECEQGADSGEGGGQGSERGLIAESEVKK